MVNGVGISTCSREYWVLLLLRLTSEELVVRWQFYSTNGAGREGPGKQCRQEVIVLRCDRKGKGQPHGHRLCHEFGVCGLAGELQNSSYAGWGNSDLQYSYGMLKPVTNGKAWSEKWQSPFPCNVPKLFCLNVPLLALGTAQWTSQGRGFGPSHCWHQLQPTACLAVGDAFSTLVSAVWNVDNCTSPHLSHGSSP